MKVIIAGTRTFDDYEQLYKVCNHMLSKQDPTTIEIVSGTAKGADLLGEKYAEQKGYPVKRFVPDWKKYGPSAGPKRNKQMADYADALIVFWDGNSRGTKNMIDEAKARGLKVKVEYYI